LNDLFGRRVRISVKMKLLAIGDLHGLLPENFNNIVQRAKPEVMICVGDPQIQSATCALWSCSRSSWRGKDRLH